MDNRGAPGPKGPSATALAMANALRPQLNFAAGGAPAGAGAAAPAAGAVRPGLPSNLDAIRCVVSREGGIPSPAVW